MPARRQIGAINDIRCPGVVRKGLLIGGNHYMFVAP
jgi:hypothetical protein